MKSIRSFCKGGWCSLCFVIAIVGVIAGLIAGCSFLIQPDPTRYVDVATYNSQMFQLLMSIVTCVSTLIGFIGLYIKSNKDKEEVAKKTEEAANTVAEQTAGHAEEVIKVIKESKARAPARASDSHIMQVEVMNTPLKVTEEGHHGDSHE